MSLDHPCNMSADCSVNSTTISFTSKVKFQSLWCFLVPVPEVANLSFFSFSGLHSAITFRRHWDMEKCADEVTSGNGEIAFNWRTHSNGRRRMIYHQMAFKMNGNAPLGRGNLVQLPKCVLAGFRSLFPSADGEYMGHRDA
jgi:hypothetical protein